MSNKPSALLCIDYQNLYHKAREYRHDFHITPYLALLRTMYEVRQEDVFIFMHADFYHDMHKKARTHVDRAGLVRLSTRVRAEDGEDPVDKKMLRELRSIIHNKDVDVILVGSSDKIFADLGTMAWHWNKEFHVYPYADPANRYRKHTDTVCPVRDHITLPTRY